MLPPTVELLIVGAGFAGLRAARAAARRGLRVLVLERKRILGEPVRTSGASWTACMQALEIPPHLYHPVSRAAFYSAGASARLEVDEPPGCILHVAALVRHLAVEARSAGARVVTGVEARGLERAGEAVVGVATAAGAVRAGLVLDASGVASFLSRRLGGPGFTRYGLGAEVTLEAPAWPQDEVAFWLGPPLAPAGYAWAFPEGRRRVRVGMGILRPDHPRAPREALESLLGSGRPEVAPLAGRPWLEVRTGAIPAQEPPVPLTGPGWLTVGDSAGAASPLLGEGIRFCLEMGELAGQAAAGALRARTRGAAARALAAYRATWEARHGWKFRLEHRLNRRLARLDAAGWDRAVGLVGALPVGPALEVLRGRWSPAALMALLWRKPSLGLEVGRALLASGGRK